MIGLQPTTFLAVGGPLDLVWWLMLLSSIVIVSIEAFSYLLKGSGELPPWSGNLPPLRPLSEFERVAIDVEAALRSPYRFKKLKDEIERTFIERVRVVRGIPEDTLRIIWRDAAARTDLINDEAILGFLKPSPDEPDTARRASGKVAKLQRQRDLAKIAEVLDRIRRWS